jgi:alkyl hydroperoxide reductase subunit AhpC
MSAKELRQINKNNDTIQVVSFSVDANKKSWLHSLKRDTVTWTSLWDGKGRFSDTYTIYGIHGVPTFFIINPEGKILKTWFGYGDGLINETLKKMKKNEK